jgi:hypothetical protein
VCDGESRDLAAYVSSTDESDGSHRTNVTPRERRYVHEAGSASVRQQLKTAHIATSRLSAIEVRLGACRREREGAYRD